MDDNTPGLSFTWKRKYNEFEYLFDEQSGEILTAEESETRRRFQKQRTNTSDLEELEDNLNQGGFGRRYGLSPEQAQTNGVFYIDQLAGIIYFDSSFVGKIVTLKYISDSLGTDNEMIVHKFAEEAMYKWIAHAIIAGRANVPEYQVSRFKKERFAAVRTAKLRLSNIKLQEIVQQLRGKAKHIKH